MPQDQNTTSKPVDTNALAAQLMNALGMQPPSQQAAPSPLINVGGMFVPASSLKTPSPQDLALNQQQDVKTLQGFAPGLEAGPYATTPQGEDQTAREYQNRLNSPYIMFGANNGFAQRHPRLAGMADNAFLAGSLVNDAQQRAIAAGGGIAGAGAGIGSVFSGLLHMPEARMQYRQGLENVALQHEQAEAALQEERARTAASMAQGVSALENNPAKILSMYGRGVEAAGVGANERGYADMQNNVAKLLDTILKGKSAQEVATGKNDTAIRVGAGHDAARIAAARLTSPYKSGSPEDKYYKAQQTRMQSALYGKMNSKQQADIRNAVAMQYIQGGGDPLQAKKYAASQVNQWDQGVQNLFGEYSKLSPAQQQAMDFQTFASQHGVDLNHLQNVGKTQGPSKPATSANPYR